jgi:protein-S-isoprenylcysteine O-methyltransferase Ste14
MPNMVLRFCVELVTAIAVLRCGWVVFGFLQTVRKRAPAGRVEWDIPMLVVLPEPLLLLLLACLLRLGLVLPDPISVLRFTQVLVGAALSIAGLALSLWAFMSYRTVGSGHYVDPDHEVVTTGAYGLVRHPIYLGVFLIWFALAMSYGSILTLLLALFYVTPGYFAYMRSEEGMMESHLGEAYLAYERRVPMILPRISWHGREAA